MMSTSTAMAQCKVFMRAPKLEVTEAVSVMCESLWVCIARESPVAPCVSSWRNKLSGYHYGEMTGEEALFPPGSAPFGDRLADLMGTVLLDEVAALHRHLRLILPAPAEFALRARQDGARVGIDEELRQVVRGHPVRIGPDDVHHVFRPRAQAAP